MEDNHIIYGVHITNRYQKAPTVQELLTEYGCHIKTRIGLHHVDEKFCSPRGLILLEMFGDASKCQELFDRLSQIEGIDVQKMVFDHPQ